MSQPSGAAGLVLIRSVRMKDHHRPLLSSVINGVQWVGVGIVAQMTLRIGVLAVMARLVSPRDFGIVSIAFIFTSFAERLGQVGVGPAFVQRAEIDARDLGTAWILSVASGVVIAVALWGLAPLAARFFGESDLQSVLAVLAIGFIIDSFGVVSDGVLQRELRFREIVKVESIAFAVGLAGIGIALGYLGLGMWALVGANLSMRLTRTLLLVYVRPVVSGSVWCGERAKELLRTGFGFSVGKILNFLSLQGDNFIVGRLLGAEALGMYTRAYQAMTLPAMYVGQAFERVLFPALAQRQDDSAALRRGLLSTLEISAAVAIPASVGMCFLSEELVLVLFGEVWRPVVPVLSVLSCGVFFRAAYKCGDVLIRSKGDMYGYAARQAWYTGIIVIGAAVGALVNGLQGVAYAVVIGVAVNYILMTLLAGRLARASLAELFGSHVLGIWIATWVAVALSYALPWIRALSTSPLSTVALATAIGVGVAAFAATCSGPLIARSHAYELMACVLRRRMA